MFSEVPYEEIYPLGFNYYETTVMITKDGKNYRVCYSISRESHLFVIEDYE